MVLRLHAEPSGAPKASIDRAMHNIIVHNVIVIAAQQDHRRKSRIEIKLKLLSDIKKEMALLESDETTITRKILTRRLYFVSFRQILT